MILTDLQNILEAAHRRYDGSTDYPTDGDNDYDVRIGVINDLIAIWDAEPVEWNELFVLGYTMSAVAGKIQSLPSDFRKPLGSVYVEGEEYTYVRPADIKKTLDDNDSAKFYSIYGKPGSRTLYFSQSLTLNDEIEFDYYKTATALANPTDVPDMSDTMYLYNGLVAFLYEQDARIDKSTEYENKMTDSLHNMIIANEVNPEGNIDTMEY